MRYAPLAIPAILALAAACQPTPPAGLTDADRAVIDSMSQSFTKLAVAGDYSALTKMYYAEDAMMLPPNMPAAAGHAAIEAAFRTFPPISSMEIRADEMAGAGDMAYVRGRYTMTMAPPGMAAIADSGKYLEIWRKQSDGSWKSSRDMFNSDIPLPMPDTTAAKKK
jgi:ketosteroid isomerase-like protein